MDELGLRYRDPDVGRPGRCRVEKHEVAGFHAAATHFGADQELLRHGSRHELPLLPEHVLDETAAIEPRRRVPPVTVRCPPQ
jgi:hypothetical protein